MTGLVVVLAIFMVTSFLGWRFGWPFGVQMTMAVAIGLLLASTPGGRVILDGADQLTKSISAKTGEIASQR